MPTDPFAAYRPTSPPRFEGGTDQDRTALLELYYRFRVANDALDNDALRHLWDPDPDNVFFNTNGHAYYGLQDWLHIWDHYRTRLELVEAGGSGTIRITIDGGMALITDDRVGRNWRWAGPSPRPEFLSDKPYVRLTLVCRRGPRGWRVVHGHFSSGREGSRPDRSGRD